MSDLTDAQLDGLACVVCGSFDRPMVPVGVGPRGQLFACVEDEREAVRRLGVTRDTRETGSTLRRRASYAIRSPNGVRLADSPLAGSAALGWRAR